MEKISKFLWIFLFVILINTNLHAETTISVTTPSASIVFMPNGLTEIGNRVRELSNLNGGIYANAFSFANILGYPIGKATLGSFPHFQVGVSLGVGLTNTKYFEDNSAEDVNGTVPGIAPIPVLHVGLGLGGGFDIFGKAFIYNLTAYDPGFEKATFKLEKFNIYSVGGMIRYNWIPKTTLIPLLLDFGGLTFSLGGDLMRGDVGMGVEYEAGFEGVEVDYGLGVMPTNPDFDGDFSAAVKWYQLSVTFKSLAYFDVLYFLSMYSGVGVTWGYGWFTADFDGTGSLTDESLPPAQVPDGNLGTLVFKSDNKFNPDIFLPTYIIGCEINIGFFKLNAETMVNLKNREDVSLAIGTRVQF